MCRPSATSAIEPKMRPPTISATIMAPHSQITAQVLRSLFSCSAPRKLCECRSDAAVPLVLFMAISIEIGSNHFEQLIGSIDQTRTHVVLDHLGHQPGG